jgi:hypothetical protein
MGGQGYDNIKMNVKETGWRAWTGFHCLRIGTSGILSSTQ